MNKVMRYGLSIIVIIVLIVAFTPMFLILNEQWFGSASSGLFDINIGGLFNILAGFLLSYTFFIPLTFTVLFDKPEKYYAIYAFIGFELFIMLSDWRVLLPTLVLAVIGWLIGEGILRIWKMIKK